jgi:hypothetical protein
MLLAAALLLQLTSTWIRPSDAELQFAAHEGFNNTPYDFTFEEVRFKPDILSYGDTTLEAVAISPLACAYQAGTFAAGRLKPQPTLVSVKAECLNVLQVMFIEETPDLDEKWRAIMIVGGQQIEGKLNDDDNPKVVTYEGSDGEKRAGYRFYRFFRFRLNTSSKMVLRYSNGFRAGTVDIPTPEFEDREKQAQQLIKNRE